MYRFVTAASALLLTAAASSLAQTPLGTGFTYQGRVKQAGELVNDSCDFQFTLWDAATDGGQVGPTLTFNGGNALPVNQGLFSAKLDFGASALDGDERWLAVAVACPSGEPLTPVSPRQELTAAPYAAYSLQGVPAGEAGGDLGATYPDPVVAGLQGRTVSGNAPTDQQVLAWNNSAVQWQPMTSALGASNIEVFTESGVWTRPPGITKVWVRVWGGGAGGGASEAGLVGSDGGDGGTSSYGTAVVASGGTGGGHGIPGGPGGTGGAGGNGLSGAILFLGQPGASGVEGNGTRPGGDGGASPSGVGGGRGALGAAGTGGSIPGSGGGGGGTSSGNPIKGPGGGGGGGGYAEAIVIVTGDVAVTVGAGGAGGAVGVNPGGNGGSGMVIIVY